LIKKVRNIFFPMLELEFDLNSVHGDYLNRLKDYLNKKNITWKEKKEGIEYFCRAKNLIDGFSFTNLCCTIEKLEGQGIRILVKFTTITKLLFTLLFLQFVYFMTKYLENADYHYLFYFILYSVLISNILFWASIIPTYKNKLKN